VVEGYVATGARVYPLSTEARPSQKGGPILVPPAMRCMRLGDPKYQCLLGIASFSRTPRRVVVTEQVYGLKQGSNGAQMSLQRDSFVDLAGYFGIGAASLDPKPWYGAAEQKIGIRYQPPYASILRLESLPWFHPSMATTDLLIRRPSVGCPPNVEEELPMTMQVGMLGTDGVLLASDTKYMNQGSGVRHSFNASKIMFNRERGIAISRAHHMETAKRVADAIVSDLKDSEREAPITPIERIASRVIDPAGNRKQVECLIAFVKPSPRLFYLQSGLVDLDVHCEQVNGAINTGDKENPAIFWREHHG
jgi:hypothetical protein